MQAFVCYRVELEFVEYCGVLLAVEVEVNDVCARSVGDSLELLCVNGEKYVLYAAAVEVARYETLLAESLDYGLVANLAGSAVKNEMLHLFIN